MVDVPPNSTCSKCGAKNTLERDSEGDLHCWACGTDQEGKNPDAVALEEGEMKTDESTNISARHSFYEKNRDAIVADLLKMGKHPARRKWRIPKGTLPRLIEKWLTPAQVAIMNQVGMPETRSENGQLPPLPPFSTLFDGEAQVKWLEIYEKLLDRTEAK